MESVFAASARTLPVEFDDGSSKSIVKSQDYPDLILAKKSSTKKSKSKKKSPTSSSKSKKETSTSAKRTFPVVQAGLGIISGVKQPEAQTGIVLTGDYKAPITDRITWQLGSVFWRYDIVQDLYASANFLLTFGGGAGYLLPLNNKMWLEGAAHLYYAMLTIDSVFDVDGEPVSEKISKNSLGLSIQASFHFSLGAFNLGPEIRIPILFNKEVGDYSANYILFFVEMEL